MGLDIVEIKHDFRRALSERDTTDYLVFHHMGRIPDRAIDAEEVHRWHLERGWNGIGYWLVIRRDGTKELGRPFWAVGAHVKGLNSTSVGVCCEGDFDNEHPTEEQLDSCLEVGSYLRKEVNPGLKVVGHTSFSPKTCPGVNFPTEEVRAKIKGDKPVERQELSWQKKQAIEMLESLADQGLLNDPEQHIEKIKNGESLGDFVYLTLIDRLLKELKEG